MATPSRGLKGTRREDSIATKDQATRLWSIKLFVGVAIGFGFQLTIRVLNGWFLESGLFATSSAPWLFGFGLLGCASGVLVALDRGLALVSIAAGAWLLGAVTASYAGLHQEIFLTTTSSPAAVLLGAVFLIAGLLRLFRRDP
jgi:hypothetical protein